MWFYVVEGMLMVKREELKRIFKNTYDREPTSEQLKTFEEYLKLIGVPIE
jgi:hypothetical protein